MDPKQMTVDRLVAWALEPTPGASKRRRLAVLELAARARASIPVEGLITDDGAIDLDAAEQRLHGWLVAQTVDG